MSPWLRFWRAEGRRAMPVPLPVSGSKNAAARMSCSYRGDTAPGLAAKAAVCVRGSRGRRSELRSSTPQVLPARAPRAGHLGGSHHTPAEPPLLEVGGGHHLPRSEDWHLPVSAPRHKRPRTGRARWPRGRVCDTICLSARRAWQGGAAVRRRPVSRHFSTARPLPRAGWDATGGAARDAHGPKLRAGGASGAVPGDMVD